MSCSSRTPHFGGHKGSARRLRYFLGTRALDHVDFDTALEAFRQRQNTLDINEQNCRALIALAHDNPADHELAINGEHDESIAVHRMQFKVFLVGSHNCCSSLPS